LPQIAGLADHYYTVEKAQKDSRVISLIKYLNAKEQLVEAAKLISGEEVTETSLNVAKQLMNNNS